MLTYLNENSFADTVENNEVVLIDFYADWCGPCKAIHPTLEKLAEEFDGKATIAKVNVDENPELSAQFKIRSIPTLLFFKNGEMVKGYAGLQSKNALSKDLNGLIAN